MKFFIFFKDLFLLFYYQRKWNKYLKITGHYIINDNEAAMAFFKVAKVFEQRYRSYDEKMSHYQVWKSK